MPSDKQQYSWRINAQAKANNFNFNFRFRATSVGSNWTLHRFSVILKFRKFFVFTVNSDRPAPIAPQSRLGFFRTRVLNVIQKFQARINMKNRSISGKRGSISKHPRGPIHIGFWVFWFLASVAQSIWKKYRKGNFIILGSVGFMAVLLMKKDKRAKLVNARDLSNCIAVIVACLLLFMFESYWDRMGRYAAKQVRKLISCA